MGIILVRIKKISYLCSTNTYKYEKTDLHQHGTIPTSGMQR